MGKLQINGDLFLAAGDEDRFLTFNYTGSTGYDWRIGYLGSGSGNENFLVIQSDKTGSTFYNALKFGLTTLNAEFGGTVTASSFIGSLDGNASSASAAPWSGITGKPSYYDAKAIKSISRSGTTFTATHMDGTTSTFTQRDNDTTYTFTNKAVTLAWGTTSTIATVGGVDITLTMPANPDTNIYGRTANTTSKIFLMGGTSQSASNKTTYSNVNCYASGGYLYSGSTKVSVEGHTHSYLPLSGGTMTGILSLKANQYFTDSVSGMDCNNSDIIDLNAIYFGDTVDSAGEGINFYRSSTTWDSIYAKSGALYFHPNRATATNVSGYTVLHSNNWSSYCAAASHSHSGYASSSHTHSGYASSSHTHSGYASLSAHNNLTASGNEFTFASSAFSGVMYVNYRTASGSLDGSISEYRFQNGAGKETAIRCTYVYGTAQSAEYATSAGSASYAGYLPSYTEYSTIASLDGFLTNGVLRWAKATSAALSFGNDGSVISVGWGSGYGSQVWLDDGSGPAKIAVRNRSGGTSWNGWRHCVMSCSETYYGSSLPSSGNVGDVFFKI